MPNINFTFNSVTQGLQRGIQNSVQWFNRLNRSMQQTIALQNMLERTNAMAVAGMGKARQIGSAYQQQLAQMNFEQQRNAQTTQKQAQGYQQLGKNVAFSTTQLNTLRNQMSKLTQFTGMHAEGMSYVPAGQIRKAGGQFGPMTYQAVHTETGMPVQGMGRMTPPEGMSSQDFYRRILGDQGYVQQYQENLKKLNQSAASEVKMRGESAMASSQAVQSMRMLSRATELQAKLIKQGPHQGQWGLYGQGGQRVPGAPFFHSEASAKRFAGTFAPFGETMENMARKQDEANRRQGVSFGQMLGLMVKFGAAMTLIEAPFRVMQNAQEVTQTAGRIEQVAVDIRSLVAGLEQSQIPAMMNVMGDIASKYRIQAGTPDEAILRVGGAGDIFASAVETMPLLPGRTLRGTTFDRETSTIIAGMEQSAMMSQVLGTGDPSQVAPSIARLSAGYQLPLDDSFRRYANLLAAVQDVGTVEGAQLADFVGESIGPLSKFAGGDPEKQYQYLRELVVPYAAGTILLSPERAATGMRNMLAKQMRPDAGATEFMNALYKYTSTTPGLDPIDIRPIRSHEVGPAQVQADIFQKLGPQGPLVQHFLGSPRGRAWIEGEGVQRYGSEEKAIEIASKALSESWVNIIFPEIRAYKLWGAAYEAGNLETTGRKIFNLADQPNLAEERFVRATTSMQAAASSRDTARTMAYASNINLESLRYSQAQSARQYAEISKQEPGFGKLLRLWTKDMSPENLKIGGWEPFRQMIGYSPHYFDFKQIKNLMDEGVPYQQLGAQFIERWGSAPPGLEPGQKGYTSINQLTHFLDRYDIAAPKLRERLEMDSRTDIDRLQPTMAERYREDLESAHMRGQQVPEEGAPLQLSGNQIEINVTVASPDDDDPRQLGTSIGTAVMQAMLSFFQDEGLPDATQSVPYRGP